jgi:hypothetical protein
LRHSGKWKQKQQEENQSAAHDEPPRRFFELATLQKHVRVLLTASIPASVDRN